MNWLKKNSVMPGLTGQLIAVVLFLLSFPLQAQDVLSSGNWTREQVADGIVLSRAVFEGNLFGSNQYLCVLEVAPGARFDIVPAEEGTLETTTALAVRTGAVAAVNGSFFNMRKPYGSVNYLRVDGTEVSPNVLRGVRNTRRTLQQTGAVATWEGSLYMLKGDVLARWERDIEAEDIVTTGPMLLVGGECEPVKKDGFNTARHPRTAVGRRADGTVVLVVADGRNELAAGLTMAELQQVMAALGCRDAINLDGGGSSTMVFNGSLINNPTTSGRSIKERSVSDIVYIGY